MISFLFLVTLIPIFFKKLIPIFNLGLSFLLSSPRFLNVEIPLALAATRKMIKNSSMAELFKSAGQFIPLRLFLLFTKISEINSLQQEITENDYAKQLLEASISDSELILQNFFDGVTDDTFIEQDVNWESLNENQESEEWEELIETNEPVPEEDTQLRTAGVQGYVPLYNTNNN